MFSFLKTIDNVVAELLSLSHSYVHVSVLLNIVIHVYKLKFISDKCGQLTRTMTTSLY